MFVGRNRELAALNRMYAKQGFQMVVVYGRRRVGKTTLIDRFAQDKPALYFTAQQKSSLQNLAAFSRAVYAFFGQPEETMPFSTWSTAFSFVAKKASEWQGQGKPPLVLVFDEFPYAAESDPSLPSVLQIAIDHEFSQTDVRFVLCGSNEGFMESEVLGRKSPLYGRRTMQIRVLPFDYLDAARMVSGATPEDSVRYYATFGGTPYYLSQLDSSLSYEENVRELLFSTHGLLYEEPLMLLRQELREPALYNSVLDAIGGGATTPKRIADKAGVNPDSLSKYLKTLRDLGIVSKDVPFGEGGASSRRSRYSLGDPFFSYWYRFVSGNVGAIEAGAGAIAADRTAFGPSLETYVGQAFEAICLQWVIRRNGEGKLPFIASAFGKWWGADPRIREQVDIDLVAADTLTHHALFGECKWRNEFDETAALRTLEERAMLVKGCKPQIFALFSKRRASEGTVAKATKRNDVMLVSLADLYEDA